MGLFTPEQTEKFLSAGYFALPVPFFYEWHINGGLILPFVVAPLCSSLKTIGAGTGATVGKLLGMDRAMKSGLGSSLIKLPNGGLVGAIVAVNAVGDIIDPDTGKIVAGPRGEQKGSKMLKRLRDVRLLRIGEPLPSNDH